MTQRLIMLPTDEGFTEILHSSLPIGSSLSDCFVVRADSGVLEAVNATEMSEYAFGGEYDERLSLMGDDDDLEFS